MFSKNLVLLSILSLCLLAFSPPFSQADVTLTVGKGSALPGSTDSLVEISLENQNDLVRGVQVDICDVDDYLACAGCETTDRTSGFICSTNERDDGCCRVVLLSFGGDLIEVGEGPIFTIEYDVSGVAPQGECIDLNPEEVLVSNEFGDPFPSSDVTSESGGFCFPCASDADCDDGLSCNGGESCVDGACLAGTDLCTTPLLCDERNDVCVECYGDVDCDDGEFCNGAETCDGGICQAGSNPCAQLLCNEIEDECYCDADEQCDDDLFCTGDETCVGGVCQTGNDPCPDDGLYCTGVEGCDEDNDVCTQSGDPCVPPLLCDDAIGACVNCLDDSDCDDEVDCTMDSCDQDGNCQNEPNDTLCDDGVGCTDDTCDPLLDCQFTTNDANCDDSNPCTDDICDQVNDCQNDPLPDGASCDDGLYCTGTDTCIAGSCESSGDPCLEDTTCNESTDSCEDITTTTTTSTPPPPPPSYNVSISPSSATLDSDATLQFSARTTSNGQEIAGTYIWEIIPASTIGSNIDENGLFTAGENTTGSEVEETVTVTDTDHENKSTIATVTIKVKEEPLPECEVKVSPSTATVSSGATLSMGAETTGDGCLAGDYNWSIETEIGSVVDQSGNYIAGINSTGSEATDVITVIDSANFDISDSATITVESKIVSVFPDIILGSRWIPLPYILLITGEDTTFKPNSNISISFNPEEDILPLGQVGLGNMFLAFVFLKAGPQEGVVDVIIDTGGEVVTGEITIGLLPFPLAEDYTGVSGGSYMEISFDTPVQYDTHSMDVNPL